MARHWCNASKPAERSLNSTGATTSPEQCCVITSTKVPSTCRSGSKQRTAHTNCRPAPCRSELASRWHRPDQPGCLHRWQASSHRSPGLHPPPCRSELARDGCNLTNPVACIAGKPAPTDHPASTPPPCRSELARDGSNTTNPLACIAGKPAPTDHPASTRHPVGASLPRDGISAVSLTGAANTYP